MRDRSVRRALAEMTAALRAAGVDDPARDARLLVAAAMRVDPGHLSLEPDARLDAEAEALADIYLYQRAQRRPVAQILGRRAFWKHEFHVTRDTLDPRPETELLVETALAGPFSRLLDLGTGTGCIGLSLLAARPAATGVLTDLSEPALTVARANAGALGLTERATLVRSDWFGAVSGSFDLIVSNPPYIAESEMAALAPEVRDWEPRGALSPGGDGLDAYRAIAAGAGAHLTPGGRLIVEIGPTQAAAVRGLFDRAGLTGIGTATDLDGRDRLVFARKSG